MKIIGLTGGSGVGKSAACSEFLKYNAAVLDADMSYRGLCASCAPMLEKISAEFGDVLNSDGSLNRKKLGSIVFSDPNALEKLNSITHPYIIGAARDFFEQSERDGRALCVYDAPVLFESGAAELCDLTIAVLSERETRIQRIMKRDSISREYAAMRVQAQHPDDWYRERCDFCIVNNGDLDALHEQLSAIIHTIL